MTESVFQDDVFKVRLRQLNHTQNSIQLLSLWIAHHSASIERITKIWAHEVRNNSKGSPDWILAMFYLANDVIQVNLLFYISHKRSTYFQFSFRMLGRTSRPKS